MTMKLLQRSYIGIGLLSLSGLSPLVALGQDPPPLTPPAEAAPAPDVRPSPVPAPDVQATPFTTPEVQAAPGPDLAQNDTPAPANPAVKPLTEGPLHEAFLSPAKDREPTRAPKAPPAPIVERPGIDRPDAAAQWIDGYWDWDASKNDFLWVTGTWRVPPPGRFWVNSYWKRDDKGWYRVAGFWSDRQTDRVDYRKDGPPTDHPDDDPGPSPGDDYFYIPGHYAPDGNGVVWK